MLGRLQQRLIEGAIAGKLKDVAEGKHGPKLKAAYWWVHKYALYVGLGLGAVDYVAVSLEAVKTCAACATVDHWVTLVAGVLGMAGLAAGFHAAPPPSRVK